MASIYPKCQCRSPVDG
ncbi:uncharacterized protein FFFS_11561 [Fusarium fujikuroi]|nr:uncharacterized protein FFFS_11561 [Fusarium fujikuroi]